MLLDPEGRSPGIDDGVPIARAPCSRDDRESRASWLEREVMPHADLVRRTLARRYPSIDMEDVIQGAFLRLMATKELKDKDGPSYLYLAAKSEILDQARRARVRKSALGDLVPLEDGTECTADEPSAEDALDSRRALQRFWDIFQTLSGRQQAVVDCRRIEGLCARATAARLATSISSVEKLQKHAMRRLRAAMAIS